MSKFELIEFQFDPDDFSLSLEDEFQITRLAAEIDKTECITSVKDGAKKLLQLAVHRQAIIRNLVRRLADLESGAIRKMYTE